MGEQNYYYDGNMDTSSSSSGNEENQRDFEEEAREITHGLLPKNSKVRYTQTYNEFMTWKNKNKINSFDENIFLVFFNDLFKYIKPSTAWSKRSMLKSVIYLHHGVNINEYEKLKSLLKNNAKGFIPKKSKVLTWNQIKQFLDEADDSIYLASKVIVMFGLSGALRTKEISNLMYTDVEDTGKKQFMVTILHTKNDYPRTFFIGSPFYEKIKTYMALRPTDIESKKFFVQFINGKCTRNVIGKNKIAEISKMIASFLNLPDLDLYTGHCFRRTAATLAVNAGASVITLKQLGGWKSSTIAEGYVENSITNKKKIFNSITQVEGDVPLEDTHTNTPKTTYINSNLTSTSVGSNNSDNPSINTDSIHFHKSVIMEMDTSSQNNLVQNDRSYQSSLNLTNQFDKLEDNDSDHEWFKNVNVDDYSLPSHNSDIKESPKINKNTNSSTPLRSTENFHSFNLSPKQSRI